MDGSVKNAVCRGFRWHTWPVLGTMIGVLTAVVIQMSHFMVIYFMIALCAVYSIGAWCCSENLARQKPNKVLVHLPDGTSLMDRRVYWRWLYIPILTIVLIAVGLGLYVYGEQMDAELRSLNGRLYPSNESVDVPCRIRTPNDLVLMIGTNAYISHGEFP